MEFHLTYDGPLPSGRSSGPRQKHDIRVHIHPQLAELWRTHPALVALGESWEREGAIVTTGKWTFKPLVSSKFALICRLNIIFLRPGPPGMLVAGGDLDNRLKTLFDALRVPQTVDELPGPEPPGPGAVCCLLEDDRLISGLTVDADQLLGGREGGGPERREGDVRLIIQVSVKATKQTIGNMGLLI